MLHVLEKQKFHLLAPKERSKCRPREVLTWKCINYDDVVIWMNLDENNTGLHRPFWWCAPGLEPERYDVVFRYVRFVQKSFGKLATSLEK